MSLRDEIVDGMAENLWANAWARHVDEHRCYDLRGAEVTEHMPPVPKEADAVAEKWAKEIERRNKASLVQLYDRAMSANVSEGIEIGRRSTPDAFGWSLAYMASGAGVSWFDDNAEFDLDVPDHSSGGDEADLMFLAGERCEMAEENPPCPECGAFNEPRARKCANCGEKLSK